MKLQSALLIIDVQSDFCPGGSLPVPEGEKIIPTLNKYVKIFVKNKLPVFASRDWHPLQTKHFQQHGGEWPRHCIQNTTGAQFHPVLKLPEEVIILSKGMDPAEDSYSAFQAVNSHGEKFDTLLKNFGVTSLYVGGLATEYCVRWSVLDALHFGYRVTLLMDTIKGVNIKPKDSEEAIAEMLNFGAKKTTFEKFYRMISDKI
jgi:nicotinamidase/pyrazinamidase